MPEKRIIGLTGPIASGKNSVANILSQKGFFIIDVDKIGHLILEHKKMELQKAFGLAILDNQGMIDRRKLGQMVFDKKKDLAKLEAIVHPFIRKKVQEEINSLSVNYIVVNAALLKKIDLIPLVNEVWVVAAKEGLRLKRLQALGFSLNEARQRIKVQGSLSSFRKIADKIIFNNKSFKDLEKRVSLTLQ